MNRSICRIFLFFYSFAYIGCTDNVENNIKVDSVSNYDSIIKNSDYSFKGISFFTKNATYTGITKQLKERGISYAKILESDWAFKLVRFNSDFGCCPYKTILYLPSFDFGTLRVYDVFLIFEDDTLALFEIGDFRTDIRKLKTYFKKKYIDSSISLAGNEELSDSSETFRNKRDSITVLFKFEQEKIVLFSDLDEYYNKKMIKERNDFLKKYHLPIPIERIPIPAVNLTNERNVEVLRCFVSFQIKFPNKLKECCNQEKKAQYKTDIEAKKKYETDILKDL